MFYVKMCQPLKIYQWIWIAKIENHLTSQKISKQMSVYKKYQNNNLCLKLDSCSHTRVDIFILNLKERSQVLNSRK